MESEITSLDTAMTVLNRIRENAAEALEVHRLGEAALNLLTGSNAG